MAATKRPPKRPSTRTSKAPRRDSSPEAAERAPRGASEPEHAVEVPVAPRGARPADRMALLEAELQKTKRAREDDEATLGSMLARIAEVERAKRDAEARNAALGKRISELEEQLAQLGKAPSAQGSSDADARLRELTAQRDGFERAARTAAERERSAVEREKEASAQAQRVTIQRDGFERSMLDAEKRARAAEERAAGLAEDETRATAALAERDAASARAEGAEKERDEALARAERAARERDEAVARTERAQMERDDATSRAERAGRERDEAVARAEAAAKDRARIEEDARMRVARHEKDAVEIAAEIDDMTRRLESQTARADEHEERARSLERRFAGITSEIAFEREAREELEAHLATLEAELERVARAIASAEQQNAPILEAARAAAALVDDLSIEEERVASLRARSLVQVKSALVAQPLSVPAPRIPSRPAQRRPRSGDLETLPTISLPPEAIALADDD